MSIQESLSIHFDPSIIEQVTKIIYSIRWRAKAYWEFWLSRHEYTKYDITEYQFRNIIKVLRDKWYITFHKLVIESKNWRPSKYNLYSLGNRLKQIFATIQRGVENINDKIIAWTKQNAPIDLLRSFGIQVKNNGKFWKLSVNKKTGAISDWKENKKYNLFNYLRDYTNQNTLEFFNNFVWVK